MAAVTTTERLTEVVTRTVTAISTSPSSTLRAKPQGGIISGSNPSQYDPNNPIIVFIIQAGIIIILCRIVHWPLSKIRQPRVIAEVITGILLGPSVLGHIPNFTTTIFPILSMQSLSVAANLGLILFLFLVGLETNLAFLISNWRVGLAVSALGMILPFGLGCAVSYGLYHEFQAQSGPESLGFGTYMLFIGVAMAITAFPVLCRILTELKLLSTNVGVITLSAGVGNDVVGWILLALCVALVNAGSGVLAVWILLVAVGYVIFLTFVFRPLFLRYLRWTGALEKGPSQSVVAVTLVIALASAFFTQVIGIHAIFGGFLIGLLCPHEGGFAIKITEKVEDLVVAIFLPLYFTLSGISTNLGLLDTGIIWGYEVAIIAIAFIAKVTGGALASRFGGLLWRESLTIGILMSCKGLVELIVLNIGLQAGILNQQTFTMFVVMALVTTCATTPLTTILYPKWYQVKVARWRRGEIDWDGKSKQRSPQGTSPGVVVDGYEAIPVRKLFISLRLDCLPDICMLTSMLNYGNGNEEEATINHPGPAPSAFAFDKLSMEKEERAGVTEESDEFSDGSTSTIHSSLQAQGIRMVELTDRDSSVMQVSQLEELSNLDPVVNIFRTFGQVNNISVMAGVTVVPEHSFADTIIGMAQDSTPDMLLIPWGESDALTEHHIGLDAKRLSLPDIWSGPYSTFVSTVLAREEQRNVGILVVRNAASATFRRSTGFARNLGSKVIQHRFKTHHVVFPFFGGDDDRFALQFVLQLARNGQVTATILQMVDDYASSPSASPAAKILATPAKALRRTIAGKRSSRVAAASEDGVTDPREDDQTIFNKYRDTLPLTLSSRVIFRRIVTPPVSTVTGENHHSENIVKIIQREMDIRHSNNLIVVGRRHSQNMGVQLPSSGNSAEARGETLGLLGHALVRPDGGLEAVANVLVLQARKRT